MSKRTFFRFRRRKLWSRERSLCIAIVAIFALIASWQANEARTLGSVADRHAKSVSGLRQIVYAEAEGKGIAVPSDADPAKFYIFVPSAGPLPTTLKFSEQGFAGRSVDIKSEASAVNTKPIVLSVTLLLFAVTYYNVFLRPV
ncbi:hypothetical protein HYR54_05620 [Candidatus Acetothermia bacterium]|nr:hypothetical protein [Candidatus Acetothermia bacterium]MBI3460783.1 hypothetical protein [Candidatus Acetothermia bacterium]